MPSAPTDRPPAMMDVAALAGVSHQTVSRVLNDHPSVRPQTRERVLDAIATLGYRRNSAARALVTRRTGTIGVVTPASALHGPTSTLVGLEEAARVAGMFVSVATMRIFDGETMRRALDHFLGQGVDAVAVVAPTVEAVAVLAGLRAPVPVVVISSAGELPDVPHLSAVGVDQAHGARLATSHLLAAVGEGDVVHVAGPQDWFDAQDRLAGWRSVLAAAGRVVPAPLVAGWAAQDGYALGLAMADQGLPAAVFAANDQLALGLLHAFWERGVRVPAEVLVVGFDDEVGAAHFTPPLTTVRQDFGALGTLAVDTLIGALEGAAATRGVIPAELVVRESSTRG